MKHFLFFALYFLFFFTFTFAHGGLENMKGADLEKIQRMLVKEGYLKTPKQYGVFTVESELAYDAWDSAQLQKRNEAYMNELRAKVAEKEAAEAEFEKSLTWFQKLMRYLKSFF